MEIKVNVELGSLRFKPGLHSLLAVWLWAHYPNSLSVGSFVCVTVLQRFTIGDCREGEF